MLWIPMRNPSRSELFLPLLFWLRRYDRETFLRDAFGAAIVSFLFIPQSLAYAVQAGLPASAGLYASIVPVFGYALFGTSRTLAIGPFAITSLMTGTILSRFAVHGSPEYAALALALALICGLFLILMGLLRLGFLANFLSYPVTSGYITASALLIALSQFKLILGVHGGGTTLPEILPHLVASIPTLHMPTAIIGILSIIAMGWSRIKLAGLLLRWGLPDAMGAMAARAAPLFVAAAAGLAVYLFHLQDRGVAIVGPLNGGIPPLTLPPFDIATWAELAPSAALLAFVGFIGSVSTAQSFAAKERARVLPDHELVAQGAANVLAGFFGGFPVTGGFSRTVVNYSAGVRTPVASIMTGLGIALVSSALAPLLYFLPQAVLAAIVIVSVMSLADVATLKSTWTYSRADFTAAAVTIAATLMAGVEIGILAGVLVSIALYLYRASRPHLAVVGLVPNTEHFRNEKRYEVITSGKVLGIRVDESLFFANARYLEEQLAGLAAQHKDIEHLVLICSAVNSIDASALQSLESLNRQLFDMGVTFHLSEVKGPVMDRLQRSDFLQQLTGRVYLSQFQAMEELDPEVIRRGEKRAEALRAVVAEMKPGKG